jgi:hypothetical protein
MDVREIVAHRLRSQLLGGPVEAKAPAEVVARFGAMQAQEFAIARWSIGQRARGFDEATLRAAIDNGQILRTHALRPTWHFVAATDLDWLQALTGPRVHAVNAHYYRLHGLDAGTADRTNAVIVDALAAGRHLTRPELGSALADAGLPATGNRLAYVVMWAELDGLIANGPMRGTQHTYALVRERAPTQTMLRGDAALGELTRRYFTSHGPATVKDFAWWSSLTITQIRHGIALLGDELAVTEVDGLRYYHTPIESIVDGNGPRAQVLQAYDEYIVGYTQSRPITNLADVRFDLADLNASVHSVVIDGQVAGLWRRVVQGKGIRAELELAPWVRVRDRRAIDEAFDRFATFIGTTVTVATGATT